MSKLPSVAVAVCRRMSEFVHSTMSFTCSPAGAGPKASLSIPILCTFGLAPNEGDASETKQIASASHRFIFARIGSAAYFSSSTSFSACF
jgi:hypothetical protein